MPVNYQNRRGKLYLYHVVGVNAKGNKIEFQFRVQADNSRDAILKATKNCRLSGHHYISFYSLYDKEVID